eukprot:UN31385
MDHRCKAINFCCVNRDSVDGIECPGTCPNQNKNTVTLDTLCADSPVTGDGASVTVTFIDTFLEIEYDLNSAECSNPKSGQNSCSFVITDYGNARETCGNALGNANVWDNVHYWTSEGRAQSKTEVINWGLNFDTVADAYLQIYDYNGNSICCIPFDVYQWVAEEWEDCPSECGHDEEVENRRVRCKDENDSIVAISECASLQKPDESRTCQATGACPPTDNTPYVTITTKFTSTKAVYLEKQFDVLNIFALNLNVELENIFYGDIVSANFRRQLQVDYGTQVEFGVIPTASRSEDDIYNDVWTERESFAESVENDLTQ